MFKKIINIIYFMCPIGYVLTCGKNIILAYVDIIGVLMKNIKGKILCF